MAKRAILYLVRHPGRMVVLILVLLVFSTLVTTGLAIRTAAEEVVMDLRRSVGGSIRLKLDETNAQNWNYVESPGGKTVEYTGSLITDRQIEEIMRIDDIRAYNGVGDGSVFAKDFSFISGFSFGEGSDYSRLPSVTNSEYFSYFRRGAFELVEGRHIGPQDDHAVLISTDLAQKNDLDVGDSITVQCCYDNGTYPEVSLSIVGIYVYTGDDGPFVTTSTDKRNRLIIDHKAMQEIMQTNAVQYDNGVEFFVDDPGKLEEIAGEIEELDLDWNSFQLSMDNSAYEAAAFPLQTMQDMIVGLTIGIISASIGMLVLVLYLQIRRRTHEAGVLVAVGIRRSAVLGQFVFEILLIAVIAFGTSFFTSRLIAQGAADMLVSQMPEVSSQEMEIPDDGREYLDIDGRFIPYDAPHMSDHAEFVVDVERVPLPAVYGLGGVLCAAAVLLASAPILRKKPKEMLVQLN